MTDKKVEAQAWIEACTGCVFPAGASFAEALKDGVILCKLAATLYERCGKPPLAFKVNSPATMPFKKV
jgi:hypothetical protein